MHKKQLRKIIHIDMDCFYVAIETRNNPRLDPKAPMAVGGRPDGRGVVSTCNYPARKYGVRSAMSMREALKRCPQLILIPSHFESYIKEGKAIREIFKRYTDKIEPLSLDEAYLDVSDSPLHDGSATKIAQEIRQTIHKERQLTASAGIAPNKFLAKIASEWKKPNGQKTIAPHQVMKFVTPLPVEKIHGVGKATCRKLHKHKLFTCGDIQKKDLQFLTHHFGSWGSHLFDISRGIDDRNVKSHRIRKSFSIERTFAEDLKAWEDIEKKVSSIYDHFIERWERARIDSSRIKSAYLKVKYSDFQSITREQQSQIIPSREEWLSRMQDIHIENSKPIRLLGMGVKLNAPKKRPRNRIQMDLF